MKKLVMIVVVGLFIVISFVAQSMAENLVVPQDVVVTPPDPSLPEAAWDGKDGIWRGTSIGASLRYGKRYFDVMLVFISIKPGEADVYYQKGPETDRTKAKLSMKKDGNLGLVIPADKPLFSLSLVDGKIKGIYNNVGWAGTEVVELNQ